MKILLDSVDTKVDLRNVRMRFMFFETFQYPEATITLQISPENVADLAQVRRKVMLLPYTINLHGVTKTLEADLALILISDDLVAISTNEPITLSVADFDLTEGTEKLQEAANVEIIPFSTITFDFIFKRLSLKNGASATAMATPKKPASAALESEGDFSLEACIGRFEILSRTGNIYFPPGSASLDRKSGPLLDTVVDIAGRCPGLVIQAGGHTDSLGAEEANQRLSECRAKSVASYMTDSGIEPARVLSVGFGEKRPVAENETEKGRSRNRCIEFSVGNN